MRQDGQCFTNIQTGNHNYGFVTPLTMIIRPIKLLINPVSLSMSHQDVLVAQKPSNLGVFEVGGRETVVPAIADAEGLVDGNPVLHTVGVEGEHHVCVVGEPVSNERICPSPWE